jgi:hypothetical protein
MANRGRSPAARFQFEIRMMDGSSRREPALTFSPEENERTDVRCHEIYENIATRHFDFVGVEVTRLISYSGCRFSVRDSSRRLLRHGEGESFAVPLKIRALGFRPCLCVMAKRLRDVCTCRKANRSGALDAASSSAPALNGGKTGRHLA